MTSLLEGVDGLAVEGEEDGGVDCLVGTNAHGLNLIDDQNILVDGWTSIR
jgi:hypothetical protein